MSGIWIVACIIGRLVGISGKFLSFLGFALSVLVMVTVGFSCVCFYYRLR